MRSIAWTDSAITEIVALLERQTGLTFSESRQRIVEDALRAAQQRAGVPNLRSFYHELALGRLPLDSLIDELTVGETYFFRDNAQFEFLRNQAIPELLCSRAPEHVLRLWSAGCAAGEEAYSLAILLEECGLASGASILATDISNQALTKARAATYTPWSLRDVDSSLVERYFEQLGRTFVLAPRIRSRVCFARINLAQPVYPAVLNGTQALDIVLCRNVFIYFSCETVRSIARRLFDSMAEGGFLLTAPTDPPLQDEVPLTLIRTGPGGVYRRGATPTWISMPNPAPLPEPEPEPEPELDPEPRRSLRSLTPPVQADAAVELRILEEALARGDYERVLQLTTEDHGDAAAAVLRVSALANRHGANEAERLCASLVTRYKTAAALHYLHAVLLLGLGRHDEAYAAARRVLFLEPSLAVGHFTMAIIAERCSAFDEAQRAYRNARDLCAVLPAETLLPHGRGERAGSLAAAADAELLRLSSRQQRSREGT